MTIGWHFDNTYSKLSNTFKENIKPTPVHDPELVILNEELASTLNLDFSKIDKKKLSEIFSGNSLPEGTKSIAQAYAGHQFGHFTMLGDGRAIIIGEHLSKNNKRFDIQFKGSGKTSFSRGGDGRAVLGPMLREYIISEAIHALNIPTTRSLAVVTTGEKVIRETELQGAILSRVASSHIRVGTFQYIAARENKENLKTFINYTINRHYPDIKNSENSAYELLKIVIKKQVELINEWMRVGFIHGVMNTDNMAISGETIDYGPCAFMDTYNPGTVFSSIDHQGRYAYCNQPGIAKWNLARFAETLLPFIHNNQDKAIEKAKEAINDFGNLYKKSSINMMKNKLGIFGEENQDESLINYFLTWMFQKKADFTNTFSSLIKDDLSKEKLFDDKNFIDWSKKWKERQNKNKTPNQSSINLMKENNPLVIPRNHKVEEVLDVATNKNDIKPIYDFLNVLKKPYENNLESEKYQKPPKPNDKIYKTYCGT